MNKPPWNIEGFVTAAGNVPVQKWWDEELTIAERDSIRDILVYLVNLEKKSQWVEPYFKWLGKVGEIRKSTSRGALRIYGIFDEERHSFVFLNGVIKKSKKDKQGMDTAEERRKRLESGGGTTHGFNFEEKSIGEDQTRKEIESATSGIESLEGNCLSDQSD